jgi:hypothetical protein
MEPFIVHLYILVWFWSEVQLRVSDITTGPDDIERRVQVWERVSFMKSSDLQPRRGAPRATGGGLSRS